MVDMSIRQSRDAIIGLFGQHGTHFKGSVCRCPWHDDKHASAGVYCDDGVWRFKCQVCGIGGDIFDMRAKLEGRELRDVLPKGADNRPRMTQEQRPAPVMYPNLEALVATIQGRVENVYRYTETMATIRYIPLGEDKKKYKQTHEENGKWVMAGPKQLWPLWNRESLGTTENSIIVVEGEKCVDALRDIELVAVTSAGGCKNAKGSDWTVLAGRDCVLWPDNDDNGAKYMQDVSMILLALNPPARVRLFDPSPLALPAKGDVADFLARAPEQSAETKREAILYILRDASIVSATKELTALIEDTIEGRREAVPTPWARLNRIARPFLPGTITLKCGAPGAGKSFFLLETAYAMHRAGIAVAVYMLEEDSSYHLWRLLAQLEENANLLDSDWVKANPEAARSALNNQREILDSFSPCITDAPTKQPTIDTLLEWTKQKAVAGCRVIMIDPISVANMGREPWNTAQQFMTEAKAIAREHDASIVVSVHPRKGTDVSGVVSLDDVAGGAAFTRLSQTVLWLERHHDDHTARLVDNFGDREWQSNRTIHVLKSRNGPGQGKRLAFQFDPQTLRFQELGEARPKDVRRHGRHFGQQKSTPPWEDDYEPHSG
jgi:KaiC/GvpD/RAD55 family RecA-like ATPase